MLTKTALLRGLPPELDPQRIPRHVAVIMDGNGRWAKAKGLPRLSGHKAGFDSVREIVKTCSQWGVSYLTLYAFSTENWLRPKSEVQGLMKLLAYSLRSQVGELHSNGVRLRAIGRIKNLPQSVLHELQRAIKKLSANKGLTLNLALNYGSRQELVDAFNSLLEQGIKVVDEEAISSVLDTAGCPDPDLVIRTSGEMRVSNFLLWQIAYAELYVTPISWPDFRKEHLLEAFKEYSKRDRRFGGL